MSELPEIDKTEVAKAAANKLASTNLDLLFQIASLEAIATALRDERDAARDELARLDSAE